MNSPTAVEDIFLAALDKSTPQERAQYLDEACGGDAELRRRVERLLQAHPKAGAFLEQPAVECDVTGAYTPDPNDHVSAGVKPAASPAEAAGAVIAGKYTLLEVIGEGGMGAVWRAKQTEPVKRFVAVKLIKVGMDSKQVLARFDAERQALALMDHPNIAKVLDGGIVGQVSNLPNQKGQVGNLPYGGRPFFVMELVKGVPITDYCDANKLTPQQRLELFVQACQAIQHAHQKGIIHRDIKPSNVLVALYDDKPVVKVIDFGVAKATGGTLTKATIDTGFGGVVGTPQYMSPEQATFNNLDIDTRSDVYALGVLLYELLTGSPPFSKKELEKKGFLEILRVVREEEPPRPSNKLSTADALPSLSANRGTEPKKLTGLLRNELDWIVMKALEKDRTRRYETANGFAADVQRYLSGEPVVAHPPSMGYRLKKFVRRNKGQVIAAGLVFLALIAGIAGTTAGLIHANRAAEAERLAKIEAQDEKEKAELAATAEKAAKEAEIVAKVDADRKRQEAERSLNFARKGNQILGSFFSGLDPEAKYETIAELRNALKTNLKKAVAELDAAAISDPLVVNEMRLRLAYSLIGLGEYDEARELFAKALATNTTHKGPEHPDTLHCMYHIGYAYSRAEKVDLAIPLLEQTIELQTKVYGADDDRTLQSMNCLAVCFSQRGEHKRAVPLYEKVLEARTAKLGSNAIDTLVASSNLALTYAVVGKAKQALAIFEDVYATLKKSFPPNSDKMATARNNLAYGNSIVGNHAKAVELYEEELRILKDQLGPEHQKTILVMSNLGEVYRKNGQAEPAITILTEAGRLANRTLGSDHLLTLTTQNNLVLAYHVAGKREQAITLGEDVLKVFRAKHGSVHPLTLTGMCNLAHMLHADGQVERAITLMGEVYQLGRAKHGIELEQVAKAVDALGGWYLENGQPKLAIPVLEDKIRLRETTYGPADARVLRAMHQLGVAYWETKQLEKSIPVYEELIARQVKKYGPDHHMTLYFKANLGVNYNGAGRPADAIRVLEEAYGAGKEHPMVRGFGRELALAYQKAGDHVKLAALLPEVLPEIRKQHGNDSPTLAIELTTYGLCFLKHQKWADAEPLVRESLAIREKKQPDAWTTFSTCSQLGGALLGQKKYADAEPLLLKGYEGMKAREETIPPQGAIRIPEALDRLIELYAATNKPDDVKKFKELRAKYPAAKEK